MKSTFNFLTLVMIMLCATQISGQEKESKFNLKERGLKLREGLGKAVLKVMTSKTDDLGLISAKAQYIVGMYPLNTEASDVKYYPDNITEGDHILALILMKNEGIGVYELEGEVTHNGQAMEYVGGGAYLLEVDRNDMSPKTIEVRSASGQSATITLDPVEQIKIKEVNGEKSLPVIDLEKDLKLKYSDPIANPKAEIRLAFLTDVAGARGWNQFMTLKEQNQEATIPKEAYANTTISSSAPGGVKFIDGNNYLLAERRVITEAIDVADPGDFAKIELQSISYDGFPVVLKGEAINQGKSYIQLREDLEFDNGKMEISVQKQNAVRGIPMSRASKFGLAALSVSGTTFDKKTTTSTRYTSLLNDSRITTTTTITYEFPQLPSEQWQGALELFYEEIASQLQEMFSIEFIDIELVTSSPNYKTFPTAETNTASFVSETYRNTKRTSASSVGEILRELSTDMSTDKPHINLMKETETDGLVHVGINFRVAGNKDGNVVLIPEMTINMQGRNETGNNEDVEYGRITIRAFNGVPFSETTVKQSPVELYKVLRGSDMMEALKYGLHRLRSKEMELGYDRIWDLR